MVRVLSKSRGFIFNRPRRGAVGLVDSTVLPRLQTRSAIRPRIEWPEDCGMRESARNDAVKRAQFILQCSKEASNAVEQSFSPVDNGMSPALADLRDSQRVVIMLSVLLVTLIAMICKN
jgi:hypothetical protein